MSGVSKELQVRISNVKTKVESKINELTRLQVQKEALEEDVKRGLVELKNKYGIEARTLKDLKAVKEETDKALLLALETAEKKLDELESNMSKTVEVETTGSDDSDQIIGMGIGWDDNDNSPVVGVDLESEDLFK